MVRSGVETTRKEVETTLGHQGRPWELLPLPWPRTQVDLKTRFLFVGASSSRLGLIRRILKEHLPVKRVPQTSRLNPSLVATCAVSVRCKSLSALTLYSYKCFNIHKKKIKRGLP